MSGQLPPLVLPIRVVSDVTFGVAKAAREAALAFQKEQEQITNAFGGNEARQMHARMAREWRRSFNRRIGQIHQLGGLKKRYDAGEAKAAAKKAADETRRGKMTLNGIDRAHKIRKKYDAGETKAANQREKDARALHALDVANAKARVAGTGTDLRAKLAAQRKLRDVHKRAAGNSALGVGGMLGAEKARRALGGQIRATKKQIQAQYGRLFDQGEAKQRKAFNYVWKLKDRQQKAERASDDRDSKHRMRGISMAERMRRNHDRGLEREAARMHGLDVARSKAVVTAAGSDLQQRIAALRQLEALQRRAANNQALSLQDRTRAEKAAHAATAQRIAAERKLRQNGNREQERADRKLDLVRRARARAWARVNKRGGGFATRVGGGVLRATAGGASAAARGAMSLPMVPVNAARSFSAYMEQAASHSKTIIGSMRDFAGKLYLVERFGFMMNVAGQALATPFQAALANSAMMEEQTMGIAVHLGAYARDQEMGFTQLFGKASAATQWMREQAALLPGEAEDYIEVLRQSTAQQSNAGVTDLSKILENSRDVGIVALLNGVDIQQGGRDYARMLEGRASQRERLFNVLRPKMRNKDGSQITAEQFNKLSAPEREQKISGALKPYLKFIAEYEKTYGAQAGAMKSNFRIAAERGFRPFFEFFVGGMTKVNRWMVKNMDTIAAVGQRVSGKLVNVFRAVGGGASAVWSKSAKPWLEQQRGNAMAGDGVAGGRNWLRKKLGGSDFAPIGSQIGDTIRSDVPLTTKLGQLVTPLAGFARAINGFTGLLGVATGPLRVFSAVFSNFANGISLAVGFFEGFTANFVQLGTVIDGARGLWSALVVVGGKVADIFRAVGAGVGDIFAGLLGDNLPRLNEMLLAFSGWLGQATPVVAKFFKELKPVVLGVSDFIRDTVGKLWVILKPQFEAFASWFGSTGTEATDSLLNVVALVVDAMGEIAYAAMMAANMIVSAAVGIGRLFGLSHGAGDNIQAEAAAASVLARGAGTGELPSYAHVSGGKFKDTPVAAVGGVLGLVQQIFGGAVTSIDPRVVSKVRDSVNSARRAAKESTGFTTGPAFDKAVRSNLQVEAEKYALSQQIVQKEADPFFRQPTMEAARNGGDRLLSSVKARREQAATMKRLKEANPYGLFSDALPKDVLPPIDTSLPIGDGKDQKTPKERGGNNFDFRGSRFTIEQKFADGFDADRIAILSTEQLAKLATKKTSSTLAPMSWQY